MVVFAILMPVTGFFIDKYGCRTVTAVAILLGFWVGAFAKRAGGISIRATIYVLKP